MDRTCARVHEHLARGLERGAGGAHVVDEQDGAIAGTRMRTEGMRELREPLAATLADLCTGGPHAREETWEQRDAEHPCERTCEQRRLVVAARTELLGMERHDREAVDRAAELACRRD